MISLHKYYESFLLLLKYYFVPIINHHEKKKDEKNIKKLYSSETSKNSIFGRENFFRVSPLGVGVGGGGLAKVREISLHHMEF